MPDKPIITQSEERRRGTSMSTIVAEARGAQEQPESVSCSSVFHMLTVQYNLHISNDNIEYSGGISYIDDMSGSASLSGAAREVTSDTVITALGRLTPKQLAAVIGDSTVGQLQDKYDKLSDVVLPSFISTIEQRQELALLANTYSNLQKRRKDLGLDPLPEDRRVTEAWRLLKLDSRQRGSLMKRGLG